MSGPIRVAVIGSGPSGLYAADELSKHDAISIDVVDRLPCPYGLLRYGVAPDHVKMKSLELTLRKILERPGVRFLGGVELGSGISVEELREYYDAVVYATGSPVDRRLSIPGEDLPGSFSATQFVAWYCGHPDAQLDAFTLDARSAVVVGVGNVAVDVARVLAKTAHELGVTDMPDHVLRVLDKSAIRDISIVGRRGPAHAKFTTKELRELGELANADVVVDPAELVLDEAGKELVETNKTVRRNLETLQEWSTRPQLGRLRRIHLRFLLAPVAVLGTAAVEAVQCERNELDGSGGVTGTGEPVTLTAQLLLRSVGYRGLALPGVPFDERSGVIPHVAGRVQRNGCTAAGEYVVGWIKRGPTGVIGTNKGDAKETVERLLDDLDALPRAPHREPDMIIDRLARQGVGVVSWAGWEAIDAAEQALGVAAGRTRIKIANWEELLIAAAKALAD